MSLTRPAAGDESGEPDSIWQHYSGVKHGAIRM